MSPPTITIAIKDPAVPADGRLPALRIREMFDHADQVVKSACQEPVVWCDANGQESTIHLERVLRVDYQPNPDGVQVKLAVDPARLPDLSPQARQAVARLKRHWVNRLKIAWAMVLGVDIDRIDRQHEQEFAQRMSQAMAICLLDCVGDRLGMVLAATPPPDSARTTLGQ